MELGREACGVPFAASEGKGAEAPEAAADALALPLGRGATFSFGASRSRLAISVQDNAPVEYFTPAGRQPFTSAGEIQKIKQRASMVTLKVMENLTDVLGKQLDYHLFAQFKDVLMERLDGMVLEAEEVASLIRDPDAAAKLAEESRLLQVEVEELRRTLQAVRQYQSVRPRSSHAAGEAAA